jgi:hypothetical protein
MNSDNQINFDWLSFVFPIFWIFFVLFFIHVYYVCQNNDPLIWVKDLLKTKNKIDFLLKSKRIFVYFISIFLMINLGHYLIDTKIRSIVDSGEFKSNKKVVNPYGHLDLSHPLNKDLKEKIEKENELKLNDKDIILIPSDNR